MKTIASAVLATITIALPSLAAAQTYYSYPSTGSYYSQPTYQYATGYIPTTQYQGGYYTQQPNRHIL